MDTRNDIPRIDSEFENSNTAIHITKSAAVMLQLKKLG